MTHEFGNLNKIIGSRDQLTNLKDEIDYIIGGENNRNSPFDLWLVKWKGEDKKRSMIKIFPDIEGKYTDELLYDGKTSKYFIEDFQQKYREKDKNLDIHNISVYEAYNEESILYEELLPLKNELNIYKNVINHLMYYNICKNFIGYQICGEKLDYNEVFSLIEGKVKGKYKDNLQQRSKGLDEETKKEFLKLKKGTFFGGIYNGAYNVFEGTDEEFMKLYNEATRANRKDYDKLSSSVTRNNFNRNLYNMLRLSENRNKIPISTNTDNYFYDQPFDDLLFNFIVIKAESIENTLNLSTFIEKNRDSNTDKMILSILFQIFYTIYCLNMCKTSHNNLCPSNIFIRTLRKETTVNYVINKENFSFKTNFFVMISNFENAKKSGNHWIRGYNEDYIKYDYLKIMSHIKYFKISFDTLNKLFEFITSGFAFSINGSSNIKKELNDHFKILKENEHVLNIKGEKTKKLYGLLRTTKEMLRYTFELMNEPNILNPKHTFVCNREMFEDDGTIIFKPESNDSLESILEQEITDEIKSPE